MTEQPAMFRRDATPALSIRGLSKTFPGMKALDAVDFDVCHGEVHALIGQNGSGKSTLIKVLAGYHRPDPGSEIEVGGMSVEINDTSASRDLGLRFVHQDLGLVHDLDSVENLALGEGFDTGFAGRIRWRSQRREAAQRIRALGYDFDVTQPVRALGAAERTGIAIARALHRWEEARVLVVDEPTASLPRQEVRILFEAIRRVRERGLGVIYVSHRLDEVFDIADRVTVLRDGRRVGTWETSSIDERQLVSLMVGGEQLRPRRARDDALDRRPVLTARSLCGTVVDSIDITAASGEVLGIAGLTGSGREEVLRLLFGALPRNGEVAVDDEVVPAEKPDAAMRAGIALVPADRRAAGSVSDLTVEENCTLTDLKRHSGGGGRLLRARERTEVQHWITTLDVRPNRGEAAFATLSGGNQQKIVMAKWLRMNPRVLLLDEPTQGVDVHAKATIHALARDAATDGSAVVIASSDDAELCDTCDRVLVMRDGVIAGELPRDRLTRAEIGRLQLGGRVHA
jgi:ribose transport system ATP-binding protein